MASPPIRSASVRPLTLMSLSRSSFWGWTPLARVVTSCQGTLGAPTLILPALQVNIRAGALPAPERNETVYLKIPLNRL